jgi:hypothetical protein
VAYVRGAEDLRLTLAQLNVTPQLLEPALLSIVNLSAFTTVLVREQGAGVRRHASGGPRAAALRAGRRHW